MSPPNRPRLADTLSDAPRSALEFGRLVAGLPALSRALPRGHGRPVLALPGYGGADGSTAVLRAFLRALDYRPYPLGLGVNLEGAEDRIQSIDDALRFRDRMGSRVRERVREVSEATGERISLVGWSMGGLYAFDAARTIPERLRMVVTLGSPFGDPRGTALFGLLRRLSGSRVPIDTQDFAGWLDRRALPTNAPPVRILYSPRDGIVSSEIARVPDHPSVEHVEVDSSHLGFGVNPRALRELGRQLATA